MNKSAPSLTNSREAKTLLQLVGLMIALISYTLPWVFSVGAGLTFGGYDLAEWTSLHPVVRTTQPFLLTALFLRLPLAALAWLIAGMYIIPRKLRLLGIVLIAIALLPPLEFFTLYRDDPNYRQQMTVAIIATIALLPAWWLTHNTRFLRGMSSLIAAITVVCEGIGCQQAYAYLQAFALPTTWGAGSWLFVIAMIGLGVMGGLDVGEKTQKAAR